MVRLIGRVGLWVGIKLAGLPTNKQTIFCLTFLFACKDNVLCSSH